MKIGLLSTVVLAVSAGLIYQYVNKGIGDNKSAQTSAASPQATDRITESKTVPISASQTDSGTTGSTLSRLDTATSVEGEQDLSAAQQLAQFKFMTWEKKQFNEEWCDPRVQLSGSDQQLVEVERRDWQLALGKVKASLVQSSQFIESSHPNHEYVAPYELMPYEELRTLADNGDKWAMVTFMQRVKPLDKLRSKVAHQLIMQGASYYATQFFTNNAIARADVAIRNFDEKTANKQIAAKAKATKLLINAVAHAYLALEQYNIDGLHNVLLGTDKEPFISVLPIEQLLAESEPQIKQRLNQLRAIQQHYRAEQGFEAAEPSATVKKLFANDLALVERNYGKKLDLLRNLSIDGNERLQRTECVDKNIANYEETIRFDKLIDQLKQEQNQN